MWGDVSESPGTTPGSRGVPFTWQCEESTCQCGRHSRGGLNPWLGKIPWNRNGNPLQDSCLENPVDRGAWRAAVHGITESDITGHTHAQQWVPGCFLQNTLGLHMMLAGPMWV